MQHALRSFVNHAYNPRLLRQLEINIRIEMREVQNTIAMRHGKILKGICIHQHSSKLFEQQKSAAKGRAEMLLS